MELEVCWAALVGREEEREVEVRVADETVAVAAAVVAMEVAVKVVVLEAELRAGVAMGMYGWRDIQCSKLLRYRSNCIEDRRRRASTGPSAYRQQPSPTPKALSNGHWRKRCCLPLRQVECR